MPRFTQAYHEQIAQCLSYTFKDKLLLRHAMTHSSVKHRRENYQRLEFLGDRVLALVIAEELYRLNPSHREGDMSNLHSNLVRGEICSEVGKKLKIGDFIVVGENERLKGVNLNSSIMGDVIESIIGAIYIDGGLEEARRFILRNWAEHIAERKAVSKDAKTYLQEWSLARGLRIPVYRVLKREGLDHSPVFTVELAVQDMEPIQGEGPSKRLAEMSAAEHFLQREDIRQ